MRRWCASFFLIASLLLSGCGVSWSQQQPSPKWTTGFWFWQGSSVGAEPSTGPVDVLFIEAGSIRKEQSPMYVLRKESEAPVRQREPQSPPHWFVWGNWPDELPEAREYWVLFRYDRQGVPDPAVVSMLADRFAELQARARALHFNVAGVQLDIDSPTSALPQYAAFLRDVRKGLPDGWRLSITALLDWFRSGTSVGDVIRETDEFVPQFYDVDAAAWNGSAAVAARIDAARWGPVFNRFGKRFRIGISTFGRARFVPRNFSSGTPLSGLVSYRDLTPLDIALNPAFRLRTERNPANELVLNYEATRKLRIGYTDLNPGDDIQFILATPEAVRAAVASARRIGGNVTGVVFFRWPQAREVLAMQPDEALMAAGLAPGKVQKENRVYTVDGRCAAVACVDVYLESSAPFSSNPLHCRIRTSTELEYFLPRENMPVRMIAPSELEVSLPPYCARGRLYLGRAVTAGKSEFTVEEEN